MQWIAKFRVGLSYATFDRFLLCPKLSIILEREGNRESERERGTEVLRRVVCAQAASADIVQILAATLDVIANMCVVHTHTQREVVYVCVCVCAGRVVNRKAVTTRKSFYAPQTF